MRLNSLLMGLVVVLTACVPQTEVQKVMQNDSQYQPECYEVQKGHHVVDVGMMIQAIEGEGFWMGETFVRSAEAAISDSSQTAISVDEGVTVQVCTYAQ